MIKNRKDGFYWVRYNTIIGDGWQVREFRDGKWLLPVAEYGHMKTYLREFDHDNFFSEIDGPINRKSGEPNAPGFFWVQYEDRQYKQVAYFDGNFGGIFLAALSFVNRDGALSLKLCHPNPLLNFPSNKFRFAA